MKSSGLKPISNIQLYIEPTAVKLVKNHRYGIKAVSVIVFG